MNQAQKKELFKSIMGIFVNKTRVFLFLNGIACQC